MKVIKLLKQRRNLAIALVGTLGMAIVYIYLQAFAIGGHQNLDVWLEVIPKINLALIIFFSVLFGALLTLQINVFKNKTCSIQGKAASASGGIIGTTLAFIVPACPACVSFAALLLPAAAAVPFANFLVTNSTFLLLISIGLMLFAMLYLGGFKKE